VAEVSIHPEAEAEYEAALGWYLERSVRAADRFELAFDKAIQSIGENPKRFPLLDAIHRYSLLRRYPYSVIFRFDSDIVRLVAVAHSKRLPGYWKDRE
jgi:plasmid stabilization system protein ParE